MVDAHFGGSCRQQGSRRAGLLGGGDGRAAGLQGERWHTSHQPRWHYYNEKVTNAECREEPLHFQTAFVVWDREVLSLHCTAFLTHRARTLASPVGAPTPARGDSTRVEGLQTLHTLDGRPMFLAMQ